MNWTIQKKELYFLIIFALCTAAFVLFVGTGIQGCFAHAAAECGGQMGSATASWGIFCDFSC